VITPPVGIGMAGFAGRPPSIGVHDDLTATALVLCERDATSGGENEGNGDARDTRVAIVALDLIGLRADTLVEPIKRQIEVVTGIPPERVFLNCSHTHYGPAIGTYGSDAIEPAAQVYRDALGHYLAGVVATADAARRPVTLSAGRGSVRVGINRRERKEDGRIILGQNPEGTLDSEVQVWRFDAADAEALEPGAPLGWVRRSAPPVAVLVNYACHGVSLSSQVRLMSADFMGVMREAVEKLVGGTALYVQGACGNINPSLMGPNWEHPRLLGNTLGAEAARVALLAQPIEALPIRVARETLSLPALLPVSIEAGRARVTQLEADRARLDEAERTAGPGANAGARHWNTTTLERARARLAALEGGPPLPPIEAEVGALRIGAAALATNPSELFCDIGLAIKRDSPFPWTAVAGYTDGSAGYVPTRYAYPEGGYEVDRACRVNPEAGEMIEETSLRLLRSLA
jgi:hypothetical protein